MAMYLIFFCTSKIIKPLLTEPGPQYSFFQPLDRVGYLLCAKHCCRYSGKNRAGIRVSVHSCMILCVCKCVCYCVSACRRVGVCDAGEVTLMELPVNGKGAGGPRVGLGWLF